MPTIALFYGIIIQMFYQDHLPPHFHAKYQGHEGIFDFDGNLLKGDFPLRQTKLVVAWAEIHKDDLIANWELVSNKLEPVKISPLSL